MFFGTSIWCTCIMIIASKPYLPYVGVKKKRVTTFYATLRLPVKFRCAKPRLHSIKPWYLFYCSLHCALERHALSSKVPISRSFWNIPAAVDENQMRCALIYLPSDEMWNAWPFYHLKLRQIASRRGSTSLVSRETLEPPQRPVLEIQQVAFNVFATSIN